MSWWQSEDMLGHVEDVLWHANMARNTEALPNFGKVEICRILFDALNKTWTAFNDFQNKRRASDNNSFVRLLLEGMPHSYARELFESREIQNLVELEPPIMNHRVLREGGYRPDQEIEPQLRSDASKEHRKLVNAYRRYRESPTENTIEPLLKKLAQLLYVVRSNIAHGEKRSLANPGSERARRDEEVSRVTIPIQLALLEFIFYKPAQKLVVYGILAPGAPGEHVLGCIEGTWRQCRIRGNIYDREGLKYYERYPETNEVDCHLFSSEQLPKMWESIDTFEGSDYRRILILAKTADHVMVANVYEGRA